MLDMECTCTWPLPIPKDVSGGHLLKGSIIHTTMELVIMEFGGTRSLRDLDPASGCKELMPEFGTP